MNKILSLCTAAYNAQKYIGKMLDSVLLSRFRDSIEIIVINDGSTDDTEKIVLKYVSKYPNIVQLHSKKNGGSGSARNVAFGLAKGKYIKLLDADDFVDYHKLDLYIEYLFDTNVDVIWNAHFILNNNNIYKVDNYTSLTPNHIYYLNTDNINIPKDFSMHGVTYKTSLISSNNIRLSEGMPYVDLEWLLLPIPFLESVLYIDIPFYVYRTGLQEQSMSVENIIKSGEKINIIAEHLTNYYHKYKESMHENNKRIMQKVLARVYSATYLKYLVQEDFKLKKLVMELDLHLKKQDEEIWSIVPSMSNSVMILRKFNYWGYYPMIVIHRIYYKRLGRKIK